MTRASSHKNKRLRSAPTATPRNELLIPNQGIDASTVYTSAEAARLLKLQPRTLVAWRYRRSHPELRWRKCGRSIRYLGSDLLKFLEG
jgi:hypothetical protein